MKFLGCLITTLILFSTAKLYADHIEIISMRHVVGASVDYFDGIQRVFRSQEVSDEPVSQIQLRFGENIYAQARSEKFQVGVGPVIAFGSSYMGPNSGYAYDGVELVFRPFESDVRILLDKKVYVYSADKPSGVWAYLYDITQNVRLDMAQWSGQNFPTDGEWAGFYKLDTQHSYKLLLGAAADASDDGNWHASLEATIVPEPATLVVMAAAIFFCVRMRRF